MLNIFSLSFSNHNFHDSLLSVEFYTLRILIFLVIQNLHFAKVHTQVNLLSVQESYCCLVLLMSQKCDSTSNELYLVEIHMLQFSV